MSAMEYYVTLNGDRVAGPFETRSEAKRYADRESTNHIGLSFHIERAAD